MQGVHWNKYNLKVFLAADSFLSDIKRYFTDIFYDQNLSKEISVYNNEKINISQILLAIRKI